MFIKKHRISFRVPMYSHAVSKTIAIIIAVIVIIAIVAAAAIFMTPPTPTPTTPTTSPPTTTPTITPKIEWPTKAITLHCGWAAGGASDFVGRALALEMSEYLKQPINVINTVGASGAVGAVETIKAPADGYTWFGGASVHGTWPVLGYANISWTDFYAFLAVSEPTAIYVNWDAAWKDLTDLLNAIKANPGKFRYGTPGAGSNGHIFAELILKEAGLTGAAIHIPYTGGREAGAKLLAGEIEFAATTLGDLTDYAIAGKMRVLTILSKKDLEIRGYPLGIAPSVLKYFPNLEAWIPVNPSFGIYIPRTVPKEVLLRIFEAFKYAINQERFRKSLEERNMMLEPHVGIDSDQVMSKVESARCWALWELKIAKRNPAEFGIPRPEEWKWPPHPRAEKTQLLYPWPTEIKL